MAMNNSTVRAMNFDFSGVHDCVHKTFEFFLQFVKEIGYTEEVTSKRLDIESRLNRKNFSNILKEVANLPIVVCTYNIPKSFTGSVEVMCMKLNAGSKMNYLTTQNDSSELKPSYQLDFSTEMINQIVLENDVTKNYIDQISKNRIFEKILERYSGDGIIVNYFSDPISYTKLEIQLSQQRDLESPLCGVTQTVHPGNSNYYQNVSTANGKKEWLNGLSLFLEQSYISPREVTEQDDSFIYHNACVTSFQSSPIVSTKSSDEVKEAKPKKIVKKRKQDVDEIESNSPM